MKKQKFQVGDMVTRPAIGVDPSDPSAICIVHDVSRESGGDEDDPNQNERFYYGLRNLAGHVVHPPFVKRYHEDSLAKAKSSEIAECAEAHVKMWKLLSSYHKKDQTVHPYLGIPFDPDEDK